MLNCIILAANSNFVIEYKNKESTLDFKRRVFLMAKKTMPVENLKLYTNRQNKVLFVAKLTKKMEDYNYFDVLYLL